MASSVIRRYTPPTCTLEIIGQSSPLSRWMKQPVIKNLKFRLHFDDPRRQSESTVSTVTVKGDRSQLEILCDTVTAYVQSFLSNTPQRVENSVSLEPQGLTQHLLNLGPLAPDETHITVPLSALQLFDLANALEQYTADLVSLPEIPVTPEVMTPPSHGWRFAASLILSMGITATSVILLKDFYPFPQSDVQMANQESAEELYDNSSVAQSPVAVVPQPPVETPGEEKLLTSDEKLPPPPPVGAIASENTSEDSFENNSENDSTIASSPASEPSRASSTIASAPPPAPSFPPPAPSFDPAPEVILPPPVALEAPPETAIAPPLAELEELPSLAPAPSLESPPTELDDVLPLTEAQSASPPVDLAARGENRLFDDIPQVGEVRRYFQERWSPPESLNKAIEYNLTLNTDGTLQAISPLGETAENYLDRTEMPLLGEPFVSSLESNSSSRIRVVFSPDGTVQTFLQTNE